MQVNSIGQVATPQTFKTRSNTPQEAPMPKYRGLEQDTVSFSGMKISDIEKGENGLVGFVKAKKGAFVIKDVSETGVFIPPKKPTTEKVQIFGGEKLTERNDIPGKRVVNSNGRNYSKNSYQRGKTPELKPDGFITRSVNNLFSSGHKKDKHVKL